MNAIAWVTSVLITFAPQAAQPDRIWLLVDAVVNADESTRRQHLDRAETQARAALADDEESVEARYMLAVVLGARANTEGGQSTVRAAAELHEQLVAILNAEPGHVGARHLLGRLHAGVQRMGRLTRWIATNLLGGGALKQASWSAAEENLAYAERLAPSVSDHHLQLALLYRDTGRPQLAAEELEHVMAIKAVSAMDLAVQAEAAEVLAGLQ